MHLRIRMGSVSSFFKQHKKLLSITGTAILSVYFLLSFIFSDLGLIKYFSMKREYDRLKGDISQLETKNKGLKEEVEALKTDPDSIEALARERLGLVKEGELIYRFEDKGKEK